MKRQMAFFALAFSAGLSVEARVSYEISVKGALAQVKIMVVDQCGAVVSGAKIWGGFTCGSRMNDYVLVDGFTDTNGMYVAQGMCNEYLRFDVRKEGYYRTREKIFFCESNADPIVKDGKWQPYGELRTVVLKQIRSPGRCTPFERRLRDVTIPKFNIWMGFDLEKGSWISPWGNGVCADMLLRFSSHETDVYHNYRYEMDVSFTNNPFGGAYVAKLDSYSDLKTAYCANTNTCFQREMRFYSESEPGRMRTSSILDDSSYLVYRTRTKVDADGRMTSANYGMIKGAWLFDSKGITFSDGCFNPIVNDLSIEDGRYLRQLDSIKCDKKDFP